MASIRIVCLDYYMSPPVAGLDNCNSEFRGSAINKVPILRVFGSTDCGVKACLHIHGVFPYIYIPYDGSNDPNIMSYQIASALDKAINIALHQPSSTQQHIYNISLLSAIPFYGYHQKKHQFFKISFYNPLMIKKACAFLQNGSILSKVFQTHESHIPFHQQFMIDYNLHGMNYLRLSNVRFRDGSVSTLNLSSSGLILSHIQKVSTCKMEIDALAEEILNCLEVNQGKLNINPGIQYICEDEKQRRRDRDEDSILSPCLTLCREDYKPTLTHLKHKFILEDRLKSDSIENLDKDFGVYAAETSDSQNSLLSNSILDITSLNTSDLDLSNTILDCTALDEDANILLGMLKHNLDNDIEEDSILSQLPKEEESEDEFDMNKPLHAETDDKGVGFLNETLTIPQTDGTTDDASSTSLVKLTTTTKKQLRRKSVSIINNIPTIFIKKRKIVNSQKCDQTIVLRNRCIKKLDYAALHPLKSNLVCSNKFNCNLRKQRVAKKGKVNLNNKNEQLIKGKQTLIKRKLMKTKSNLNNTYQNSEDDSKSLRCKNIRINRKSSQTNISNRKLDCVYNKKCKEYNLRKRCTLSKQTNIFVEEKISGVANQNYNFSITNTNTTKVQQNILGNAMIIDYLNVIKSKRYLNSSILKNKKLRNKLVSNDMNHKNQLDLKLLENDLQSLETNNNYELKKCPSKVNTKHNLNISNSSTVIKKTYTNDLDDRCVQDGFTKQQITCVNAESENNKCVDITKTIISNECKSNNTIKFKKLEKEKKQRSKNLDSKVLNRVIKSGRFFPNSRTKPVYLKHSENKINLQKCNDNRYSVATSSQATQICADIDLDSTPSNQLKCNHLLMIQPSCEKNVFDNDFNELLKIKMFNDAELKFKCYIANEFNSTLKSKNILSNTSQLEEKIACVSKNNCSIFYNNHPTKCNLKPKFRCILANELVMENDIITSANTKTSKELINVISNIELKDNQKLKFDKLVQRQFEKRNIEIQECTIYNTQNSIENIYCNSEAQKYNQSLINLTENQKYYIHNLSTTTHKKYLQILKNQDELHYQTQKGINKAFKNRNINCTMLLNETKNEKKLKNITQCDGPFDSSEDEDDAQHRQKYSPIFPSLDLIVQSPRRNVVESINPVPIKKIEERFTNYSKVITTNTFLNKTISEENVSCRYNKPTTLFRENITKNAITPGDNVMALDNQVHNQKSDLESSFCAIPSTSKFNSDTMNSFPSSSSNDVLLQTSSDSDKLALMDKMVQSPLSETVEKFNEHSKIFDKQSLNKTQLALLKSYELTRYETYSIPALVSNKKKYVCIVPQYNAPSRNLIQNTMLIYNIPLIRNEDPFYSKIAHVTGSVEIGHNQLNINSKFEHLQFLSDYTSIMDLQKGFIKKMNLKSENLKCVKLSQCDNTYCLIEPIHKPPSRENVMTWLKCNIKNKIVQKGINTTLISNPCRLSVEEISTTLDDSLKVNSQNETNPIFLQFNKEETLSTNLYQISGASFNNTHDFKMLVKNYQDAKSCIEYQYLTTLVIELHVHTRGNFKPDPEYDEIKAIFYAVHNDTPSLKNNITNGIIAHHPIDQECIKINSEITYVKSETELYESFLNLIRILDPDIFVGYENEMHSWGYLVQRGFNLGINLSTKLSRITENMNNRIDDEYQAELKITGRIVLDLWRLIKHEIALQSYTFENVVYHVLHERVSLPTLKDLTTWWVHKNPKIRHRILDFYLYRVNGVLRLIEHFDLIGRTSELSRLFGILFYEVLSRGSQFRVESMMLRLAKPLNYIPVSPTVQQRANMRAPEYLPLILEPESKFYKDPVIVLDFQSLYPSIIIAYNYCFSTCIGRVEYLGTDQPFEFGATQLKINKSVVKKLLKRDNLNFSPCGIGFVKEVVRLGILPKMLQEILDTRLMVKNSMKKVKDNKTLQRVLHSRQLGLKLIANVTYGYTAANFSGRMPAVEVGDSVVAKGRETLQRAINLVEQTSKWGARVVYGDTDSLFVLVSGRSREEAFKIGSDIADAVTQDNPSPIKLKLEKVYQPCILQTKKRYVGYKYENSDQIEPEFEAKGIETVRRDGCPAVSKMLEKCLRLLFETKDVSLVRNYVERQFDKILMGCVSIQDLTFAKEYRGMSQYKAGACIPALELTRKWKAVDKRNEPRNGERVPYVIVNGPPGLPLIKLVRSPLELLDDPALRFNAIYYITKVIIPPINRCFALLGADLNVWFNEMPRKNYQCLPTSSPTKGPKTTISQYFSTTSCASCGHQTKEYICEKCQRNSQQTCVILNEKIRTWEKKFHQILKICYSCCNRNEDINCVSLDCPVLYRIIQAKIDSKKTNYVRDIIENLPELLF